MIDIFDLGLRIRNVRKAHNLTQEQLAEKIKVSPHYVYELEHGYKSMSIYTLANIATVLDRHWIFWCSERNRPPPPRTRIISLMTILTDWWNRYRCTNVTVHTAHSRICCLI